MWQLTEVLSELWDLGEEERKYLQQACVLAKADLVTTMVKEFPTLQGVVGKYYARDSGEPEAVALAIEEHYLPIADRLPKTRVGSALAIIDKYDTLTSYFGLGIKPTGDQDPFGLRRAASGIIEVVWKVQRPLPLDRLFETRVTKEPSKPFGNRPPQEIEAVAKQVKQYLLERLYTFAWPKPAPEADIIDAVIHSPCDDLLDAMERIISLRKLDGSSGLRKAAKVIERTQNILRGAPVAGEVDQTRLTEAPERKLWDLYAGKGREIAALAERKSYGEATTLYGELFYGPIHEFFDTVMVNVPDEALRRNRLALMRAIHTLYTERIADLSKLSLLQQEKT